MACSTEGRSAVRVYASNTSPASLIITTFACTRRRMSRFHARPAVVTPVACARRRQRRSSSWWYFLSESLMCRYESRRCRKRRLSSRVLCWTQCLCNADRSRPDTSFRLALRSTLQDRASGSGSLRCSIDPAIQNIELLTFYLLKSVFIDSSSEKLLRVAMLMGFKVIFDIAPVSWISEAWHELLHLVENNI